jgi:glutamate racemase
MKRDYTRDLIRSFAKECHVRLVGAPDLAALAVARMRGEPISAEAVRRQILPCFVELKGRRTDVVVLACTHYPFLADMFADLAPWPVTWLDPAPAIARRLATVLDGRPAQRDGQSEARFTSGAAPLLLIRLLEAPHPAEGAACAAWMRSCPARPCQ